MCECCWDKGYVLIATGVNGITIEIPCPKCQPDGALLLEATTSEPLKQFHSHGGKAHPDT